MEKLRSYWSVYQRAHVRIASRDNATTDEYIINDVFEQLETEVDECEIDIEDQLLELQAPPIA